MAQIDYKTAAQYTLGAGGVVGTIVGGTHAAQYSSEIKDLRDIQQRAMTDKTSAEQAKTQAEGDKEKITKDLNEILTTAYSLN